MNQFGQQPQQPQPGYEKVYTPEQKDEIRKYGFFDIDMVDVNRIHLRDPIVKKVTTTTKEGKQKELDTTNNPIVYNISDTIRDKPEFVELIVGLRGLSSTYGTGTLDRKISVRVDLNKIYMDDDTEKPCHYADILKLITERVENLIKEPSMAQKLKLTYARRGDGFKANLTDIVVGSKVDRNDLRMYPWFWVPKDGSRMIQGMKFSSPDGSEISPFDMQKVSFRGSFVIKFRSVFSSDASIFRFRYHPSVVMVDTIINNSIKVENVFQFSNKGRSQQQIKEMSSAITDTLQKIKEEDVSAVEQDRSKIGFENAESVMPKDVVKSKVPIMPQMTQNQGTGVSTMPSFTPSAASTTPPTPSAASTMPMPPPTPSAASTMPMPPPTPSAASTMPMPPSMSPMPPVSGSVGDAERALLLSNASIMS